MKISNNRILFFSITSLKLLGTFFALFIYAAFVKLGDSKGYVVNDVPFSMEVFTERTVFIEYLFSSITLLTNSALLTHLVASIFTGYCIYYTFKNVYFSINKLIFWFSLSLPHFLIWTGVASKELLVIGLFSIIVRQTFNIICKLKINIPLLVVVSILALFLRPHYGLAYIYLLLSSIVIVNLFHRKRLRYSIEIHTFIYFLLFLLLVLIMYSLQSYWEYYLIEVMKHSKNMFVGYTGSSTRLELLTVWIEKMNYQKTVSNFFSLMPNGIFMSLVGPTFPEVLMRPFFILPFIEGMIYIIICLFLYINFFFRSTINSKYFLLFIYSFIPALIIIILVHYPLGIFNPGTALRYKQALVPLMIFFPLLMLGLFKVRKMRNM